MRDDGGRDAAPSLDPLSSQLTKIDRVLRAQLALRGDGEPESGGGDSGEQGGPAISGVVRSRQDAIRALDAVSAYFRQQEPSSPVPMLLDRAKRLVSKSFLEVLADIAPEALGQARSAGGLKDGEECPFHVAAGGEPGPSRGVRSSSRRTRRPRGRTRSAGEWTARRRRCT